MPGATQQDLTALAPSKAPASSLASAGAERLPRILCVDDDPAVLAVLSRSLRAHFDAVTTPDPLLALSWLERDPDFSVVIADLTMPLMDGAVFLAKVRRLAPASTRLALTGCLERQLPPEDAFGILTKPCPPNLLYESVAAAVQHHWLVMSQLHSGPGTRMASSLRARRLDPATASARSELPARPGTRLCLRLFGNDLELKPGVTTLGRSRSCHIVIDDARVAARHARFVCSFRGVTLQDVSGKGAVRLNGERFSGTRYLNPGDWVGLGPFDAEIRVWSSEPARAPALEVADVDPSGPSAPSGSGALEVLCGVAEKLFRMGQGADAERLLRGPLQDFLVRCESGDRPTALDTELAVGLAVRLAEENREPRWADYTLRLFSSVGRSIPPSIMERLAPAFPLPPRL